MWHSIHIILVIRMMLYNCTRLMLLKYNLALYNILIVILLFIIGNYIFYLDLYKHIYLPHRGKLWLDQHHGRPIEYNLYNIDLFIHYICRLLYKFDKIYLRKIRISKWFWRKYEDLFWYWGFTWLWYQLLNYIQDSNIRI